MSSEWKRWEEVTDYVPHGCRLFRASAPNYDGSHDASQNLTQSAVDFLTSKGINGIISFNKVRYNEAELARLRTANIDYLWLPVQDFTAATPEQLMRAVEFVTSVPGRSLLVHCGYGHGRTGTCITALQLYATGGANPPESQWRSVNHVETHDQVAVLHKFKDDL